LQAFETLKRVVVQAWVLTLQDFNQPFEIECDASGRGVGAVLMQNKRPIAYFSKALSKNNLSKSTYEKELMVLVLVVQHWRPYLLGRSFVVHSDQKSLRHLLQQCITTTDQQNWLAKLLGYHFEVVYKPGPDNKAADVLSRRYEEVELKITYFPIYMQEQQIKQELLTDPHLQQIVSDIEKNPGATPGFELKQGILYYFGRLVYQFIFPVGMYSVTASGISFYSYWRSFRIFEDWRMAGNLYWAGMKKTVQEFVKNCDVCQRNKHTAASPMG
jgi:hypothetical protein